MDLRLNIDSKFMEELRNKFNDMKNKDLAEDAFALLDWAADEVKKGRTVLSTDEKGENVKELVLPSFKKIKDKF